MQQLSWRAGLVALLVASAFTCVFSAPIPTLLPNLNASRCANALATPRRCASPSAAHWHSGGSAAFIGGDTGAAPRATFEDISILNKRAPKQKTAPKQKAAPKQRAAPKKAAASRQKAAPKQKDPNAPKPPHKSVGQKLREWGQRVKKHFQVVGHKIKEGFQKFGQKVKVGFQKFGQKLKVGFQKVGHWFKTTGAKIAKFGLKVMSTLAKVGSKVIGVILPGVGKVIGKGLEAASFAEDKASDAIHVSLGAKLDKGMKVMDKVQKYVGYVP